MLSQKFMNYLMDQKVEKKIEEDHYLKKGLAGLINFVNAKSPIEQKVYIE
jgi:hypothetical protein